MSPISARNAASGYIEDPPKADSDYTGHAMSVISVLTPQRALVPFVQQEIFERAEAEEDGDAQDRQQHQGCEHTGDVEPVARFDDAPGEAGTGPRAGDELGHHGADERKPARDLHPAEKIGKRARELQLLQSLPARGAIEVEQVLKIVV